MRTRHAAAREKRERAGGGGGGHGRLRVRDLALDPEPRAEGALPGGGPQLASSQGLLPLGGGRALHNSLADEGEGEGEGEGERGGGRGSAESAQSDSALDLDISAHLRSFSRRQLDEATGGFRNSAIVGRGGFATVYLGEVPRDPARGRAEKIAVAVKCMDSKNVNQWETELKILGKLRHANLVELLGYCCEGGSLMLVYSFARRGSLDQTLFSEEAAPSLSWPQRVAVAAGAAAGLAYLHSRCVIHRDLKPSNVLLREDMEAMLTDFGLAKKGPVEAMTHVSTNIKGTYLYLDPDYLSTGHLTFKSDVYAFGILLLELVTGQPISPNFVKWASTHLSATKEEICALVDPRLGESYTVSSAVGLIRVAQTCISDSSSTRPTSEELAGKLKKILQSESEVR